MLQPGWRGLPCTSARVSVVLIRAAGGCGPDRGGPLPVRAARPGEPLGGGHRELPLLMKAIRTAYQGPVWRRRKEDAAA
ncbi:unnamed protein product [Heterosigma akashiwo]